MSVWNPENVKDIAESVGITNLPDDATRAMVLDIEFRLCQVLEEALKFMRHGKRTTLTTQDISQSLKTLGVEPLYGYESTRPLRFGEASIGPGQPLYYVEDEEMEFEKLINAPLPKVPREITFTAHWLAVEGVQPSIPQNPTAAESRHQELAAKGQNANATLAAMSGNDNVTVKPLVKHVLSKELQQYFEKVCSALLDETNNDYRIPALASVESDPGLHQLVPYFIQFIAEKVTHNTRNIFVLTQVMGLTHSILENESLFLDPYITSLIPPVLTCLLSRQPSLPSDPFAAYPLRQLAASLLKLITRRYHDSHKYLQPRIARQCLKSFLNPTTSFGAQYGAILGIRATGGTQVIRALVVPNLKVYETLISDALADTNEGKKKEAEKVIELVLETLLSLEADAIGLTNGNADGHSEETQQALEDKIGPIFAERILELNRPKVVKVILEC